MSFHSRRLQSPSKVVCNRSALKNLQAISAICPEHPEKTPAAFPISHRTLQIRIIETVYVRRQISLLAVVALLAFTTIGCDRGAHPSQVNKVAPDFSLDDGHTKVHLADMRGKVVVLNFWATWCTPCILELPSLLSLQKQLPQVVVLAVSIDEDDTVYRKFLLDHHVDLLTVRDGQQSSNSLYHTEMYPETYVIDRQGVIRRKFIGAQDWTNPEIESYLGRLMKGS
jgi:cytochrome c biogenesis protein CcmG, thiol:disulfide interchange protein DsbE